MADIRQRVPGGAVAGAGGVGPGGDEEAEELDERDDGGTEREPQPAANGG